MEVTVRLRDEHISALMDAADYRLSSLGYSAVLQESWQRLMDALAQCTAMYTPPNEELEYLLPVEEDRT